jgi:hypothetical protein
MQQLCSEFLHWGETTWRTGSVLETQCLAWRSFHLGENWGIPKIELQKVCILAGLVPVHINGSARKEVFQLLKSLHNLLTVVEFTHKIMQAT